MSIEKCMSSARTPAECYVNKTKHKQKINALPKTLHNQVNVSGHETQQLVLRSLFLMANPLYADTLVFQIGH